MAVWAPIEWPARRNGPSPTSLGDHRFEVIDQLRVSITLLRRGGIGLAVPTRVVGEHSVAVPLQAPRAMDDSSGGSR